jgi:hypothetical protein
VARKHAAHLVCMLLVLPQRIGLRGCCQVIDLRAKNESKRSQQTLSVNSEEACIHECMRGTAKDGWALGGAARISPARTRITRIIMGNGLQSRCLIASLDLSYPRTPKQEAPSYFGKYERDLSSAWKRNTPSCHSGHGSSQRFTKCGHLCSNA